MQLNPARGRKQRGMPYGKTVILVTVYAAQPREGTETSLPPRASRHSSSLVYAAQPREGTETDYEITLEKDDLNRFMQLNPARGRKLLGLWLTTQGLDDGLCSSTPRGDGNIRPRSGTFRATRGLCSSTPRGDGNFDNAKSDIVSSSAQFMQLNPARGRKLRSVDTWCLPAMRCGLCTPTPRGDGKRPQPHASFPTLGAWSSSRSARPRRHSSMPKPCCRLPRPTQIQLSYGPMVESEHRCV